MLGFRAKLSVCFSEIIPFSEIFPEGGVLKRDSLVRFLSPEDGAA